MAAVVYDHCPLRHKEARALHEEVVGLFLLLCLYLFPGARVWQGAELLPYEVHDAQVIGFNLFLKPGTRP